MKMICPQCGYHGEFKKGRVPFFIFSIIDAHFASKRARKTFVCPECGCEVRRTDNWKDKSYASWLFYIMVILLFIGFVLFLLYGSAFIM